MSLIISGGSAITDLNLDGTPVDKLLMDGVEVFSKGTPFFEGFENWEREGSNDPLNPVGWSTSNQRHSFPTVRRDSQGHTGIYNVRLEPGGWMERVVDLTGLSQIEFFSRNENRVSIYVNGYQVPFLGSFDFGWSAVQLPISGFSGNSTVRFAHERNTTQVYLIDSLSIT